MYNYTQYFLHKIKKPEIYIAIIIGLFIFIGAITAFIILRDSKVSQMQIDVDNCIQMSMDSAKSFFDEKCKNDPTCDPNNISEVEIAGFIEFMDAAQQECKRKYTK